MTIRELFKDEIEKVKIVDSKDLQITKDNVYLKGNKEIRDIIEKCMISKLLLKGSKMLNPQNLKSLYEKSLQGKSCLMLSEHPSNFDLPLLFKFIKESFQEGEKMIEKIVTIASIKINDAGSTGFFAQGFEKIVIYPSRMLEKFKCNNELYEKELLKSKQINHSAIKCLMRFKHQGKIILVFPTGTRKRPNNKDSTRILPETASYVRMFDFFLPIAIEGCLLKIKNDNDMLDDEAKEDKIIMNAGEIITSKEFLEPVKEKENKKELVSNMLFEMICKLNLKAQEYKNMGT